MNSDARRIEDTGRAHPGLVAASLTAVGGDDDPLASLGYEAADPALLARLWGEPVDPALPIGEHR